MQTRRAALSILNEVSAGQGFSSALLNRFSRDRRVNFALLQRLVKGTLSYRDALEEELRHAMSSAECAMLKGDWELLRIAAYQFRYLEKVPVPLVIKESRSLVHGAQKAELVERVLKRLIGRANARPAEGEQNAAAGSHPSWLLEEWRAQFGAAETELLCAANNQRWPVTIRVNHLRVTSAQLEKFLKREGVRFRRARFQPHCYVIESLPRGLRLHELISFEKGAFQVQDESAALVGQLLDPKPGQTVIDVCAAPGGKATHLAMLMENRGRITAIDLHESALRKLTENSRKLDVKIIRVKCGDATSLQFPEAADAVLVDAPCSGLGVLGRKVDIRWSKTDAQVTELADLQSRLLDQASTFVKPGGKLLYSTCTLHRKENQEVVERFLKSHSQFALLPASLKLAKELTTKEGYLLTLPHRHRMAGGFAALMQRKP